MRQIVGAVLALLLLAGTARAGSYSIQLAQAVTSGGPVGGCNRVTDSLFGEPYTGVLCPSSGGNFVVLTTYPQSITIDGIDPETNFINPTGPNSGTVCFKICAAVVKPGQNWQDISFTSANCTDPRTFTQATVGTVTLQDFGVPSLAIHITDTQGTICTPATCRGVPLILRYERINDAGICPDNSAQDIVFMSTSMKFD